MSEEPAGASEKAPTTAPDPAPNAVSDTLPAASERRASMLPMVAIVIVVALIAALAWGFGSSRSDDSSSTTTIGTPSESGTDTTSTDVTSAPRAPGSPGAPSGTGQTAPQITRPAAPGEALESISRPPSGTLAMVEPSMLSADARYTVVFRPYGYGPDSGGAQTLVVLIEESQPANDSAKEFDFTDRNVLATLVTPDAEVTSGGTYEGVLTLRARSGLLAPVIDNIRAR